MKMTKKQVLKKLDGNLNRYAISGLVYSSVLLLLLSVASRTILPNLSGDRFFTTCIIFAVYAYIIHSHAVNLDNPFKKKFSEEKNQAIIFGAGFVLTLFGAFFSGFLWFVGIVLLVVRIVYYKL